MGGKSELDDDVSFTEASTNSSEGTQLICQSSISRFQAFQQEKRVDDVLKSESSSSNSSLAIAPDQSEIKKQLEISVEIKAFDGRVSSDTSQLSEQLCSQKTKRADSVVSSEAEEQKNSEQGPNLRGFDLNEDWEVNDDPVSAEPISVVAKIGVPNALTFAFPRFDGKKTSWRSAPTSAFKPALPSKNPRDFDLNIAASEMDSNPEKLGDLSPNLNLSCRDKNLVMQPKSRSRGFDLNDKLPVDQDQSKHQDNASARQNNNQGGRPAYWVDLGSMPALTHVQGQPFMVTAPRTHVPMALGPRPVSGYHIGPANGLSYSQGFLPNAALQYGLSGAHMSQIPGPVFSAAYPGGLNHLQAATGQGGLAAVRPGLLMNGEVSGNGSQMAAFPGLVYKRREPEGGWDCYQVGGCRRLV